MRRVETLGACSNVARRGAALALWMTAVAAFACAGPGCGGPQVVDQPNAAVPIALPGPAGNERLPAPTSEPEELPGVDTSELVARERSQWWRLVSQLYAPCPDQAVSIAQCVREARACAACPAAARLLATQVRAGASVSECERVYGLRFGPTQHAVDLSGSPSKGPEGAPVTIVVWSDFQCPHCKHAMPILDAVFEKHSPDVRLVHKFYPLRAETRPPAKAAIAALAQGRYWPMEKALFDNQNAQAETDLDRYAVELKLDRKKFRADMASDQTEKMIERDKAEATKAGLTGTPFILINGREFDMAYFALDSDLEKWVALEIELARPGAQVAQPAPTAPPAP